MLDVGADQNAKGEHGVTVMKKLILAAMLMAGLVLALAGCSDDETTTNSTDNGLTAQEREFVANIVGDDVFGDALQSTALSTILLSTIVSGAPARSVPAVQGLADPVTEIIIDEVGSYTYSGGWHIFEFSATLVGAGADDTVDADGIDSVQVLVDGTPQQIITETLEIDELRARAHVDWVERSGQGDGAIHHSLDIAIEPSGSDTLITIDGSIYDTLQAVEVDDSATCDLSLATDQTIDSLAIRSDAGPDDCPETGHVSSTVTITADCVGTGGSNPDSLSISGTWTVTAQVNSDNTVTVTFTGANASWSVTEPCGSSAPGRITGFGLRH